ncbi:hypothetical protein L6172_14740 [Thalassospiraceae bacterium SW-3-3]|nr:hypothetical protein L6172_14740 [Thalassospiraceae bacterium SW-3-3]
MKSKVLFKPQGVTRALIVDDGVDPSPFVSDLGNVSDEWSVFWADLNADDKKLLNNIYPEYKDKDAEDLIQNQEFVSLMFENREAFSSVALVKVFETFLNNQHHVQKFIEVTSSKLGGLGLEVNKVGRDFVDAAKDVDLIVVDLFLGSGQAHGDKERSIRGLINLLRSRPDNPPMVLLTSAHSNLRNLRHDFRDETGLLASGFRTIGKAEIEEEGRLEQLVFELTEHRKDALKLWAFLQSWEKGITQALQRAQSEVRKLDLEDLSHVKQMLSSEGVPLGGYMVDIMDGVLAHELEADQGVIDAAIQLNTLEATSFPPNSITGNKNTLEVVRKTLFVHEKRRQLDPSDGFPVSLGDILAISPDLDGKDALKGTIFEGEEHRVFLVMTPVCDLVRDPPKAKRVLLLAGEFHSHSPLNFKTVANGEYTPVLALNADQRGIIKWDLKHVETIDREALTKLLNDGPCFVPARLKEQTAIALQQKLLSDLGRVGELKTMPSMFPVQCMVYYTNVHGELTPLPTSLDGILVGDKSSRLAFDAEHRFDFMRDVRKAIGNVYKTSKGKLESALEPRALDMLFTKGIEYKTDIKPKPCMVPVDEKEIEVGKIIFNTTVENEFSDKSKHQAAGLIFELKE